MTVNDTHADTIRAELRSTISTHTVKKINVALDALVAELADMQTVIDTGRLRHSTDMRVIKETIAERERERARADRAEALVERFHEAWWNWNPGDDTEALDAAASEAMDLLGTIIRLNPDALSAGSGGRETP